MKKERKIDKENIINAVVALYLNLIQFKQKEISKGEVEIIYNIIRTTFTKEDIYIEYIKNLIENPLPLSRAVNIIKNELYFPDKIKLLLNLLLIAHMDDNFSISNRLDILEIVEMLEVDIRLYSQIIDVVEEKRKYIDVNLREFIENIEKTLFSNFLLLGDNKNSDIKLKSKRTKDFNLIILLINELILIGSYDDKTYRIGSYLLKKDRLYHLKSNEVLNLSDTNDKNSLEISYDDIIRLHNNKENEIFQVMNYTKESFSLDIFQNKNKIMIQAYEGRITINGNLVKYKERLDLALNDSVVINDILEFNAFDILTEKLTLVREEKESVTRYIDFAEKFFRINRNRTSNSIVKISKHQNKYLISYLNKKIPVFLNHKLLKAEEEYNIAKDVISIGKTNLKINEFFDIVKVEYEISNLSVNNLRYIFKDDNTIGLDRISFDVHKGALLSIMGPSGSGKTTILKCLTGEIVPQKASIYIDNYDLYENFSYFQKYIAYVPQDDLLFNNLTVYEHLFYCGKLRLPYVKDTKVLKKRIDNILIQMGLSDKKNLRVGDIMDNKLSGGERKRLNIALELLSDPLIIILDEPTSGLSSKDSEKIIKILKDLKEQGKIIIATIHQPNPDIMQQFDKILFIDKNGTEVFFGNTFEIFEYFDDELKEITYNASNLQKKKDLKMAEYIFDILQYPLLDDSGNPIYKKAKNNGGTKEIQRKYKPVYWKNKFYKHQLYKIMKIQSERKTEEKKTGSYDERKKTSFSKTKLAFGEHLKQIYYLFVRNISNKLKNKANLFVTFFAAPFLALLISFILRYSEEGVPYRFSANINLKLYIFISIIIFIFLGLSNSLDEIFSEKRILIREKRLNIKPLYYLFVKNITLVIFALLQAILYFLISSIIIDINGMFFIYISYLLLSSFIGFSIGLLASSLIKDKKAIINVLPLVLIPQIIFAGAVIEFEKMNRKMKINPESVIPEFCQIIPSRWLFEGLLTAQAKLNVYNKKIRNIHYREEKLKNLFNNGIISRKEYRSQKNLIIKDKKGFLKNYNRNKYCNNDISFIVSILDGKFYNNYDNYFLSSQKIYFGKIFKTYNFNILIIFIYGIIINLLTLFIIKYKFN